MANTAHFSQVVKLQQENAEIRRQLKELKTNYQELRMAKDTTETNYFLLQEKYKELQEDCKKICHLLVDEKEDIEEELEEVKEELEEVKRERDELKRDKAIQKLGGLKLCYKS